MQVFNDWATVPETARGASIALGNFDGVHLGHASLVRAAHGARPDATLAVLTFEPHPREYFRPDDPPFRLSLASERRAALAALGVKLVFELPFTAAFSHISAERFITDVLSQGLGAAHLVCGPDFAFGHRRGGTVALLAERAEALGMGLTVVPTLVDQAGAISSTRIRRALQDGYPERANAALGRPWAIRGEVVHGEKRGRTIGFPTANIRLGRHLEPARGVYAVTARLDDGTVRGGVANIGRRPTLGDSLESRLEAHLFDFAGDLYGQDVSVALHAYIREEQKFASLDELRAQIARDSDAARLALAGHLALAGRLRPDPGLS
jgi:riboflavin kinase/FMN adenylyltransferase